MKAIIRYRGGISSVTRVALTSMGNLFLSPDAVRRLVTEAVNTEDVRYHKATLHSSLASLLAVAYNGP